MMPILFFITLISHASYCMEEWVFTKVDNENSLKRGLELICAYWPKNSLVNIEEVVEKKFQELASWDNRCDLFIHNSSDRNYEGFLAAHKEEEKVIIDAIFFGDSSIIEDAVITGLQNTFKFIQTSYPESDALWMRAKKKSERSKFLASLGFKKIKKLYNDSDPKVYEGWEYTFNKQD